MHWLKHIERGYQCVLQILVQFQLPFNKSRGLNGECFNFDCLEIIVKPHQLWLILILFLLLWLYHLGFTSLNHVLQ